LEITRALRQDEKPKELIEVNLKELMRHRITYLEVTRSFLSEAERIIASSDLYASDALHAASYAEASRVRRLEAMLSDDRHFQRFGNTVRVLTLDDLP
jgi:predicted nucleic acid-binding protein